MDLRISLKIGGLIPNTCKMDFIQGERFIEIADFTYAPELRSRDDYMKLQNTYHWKTVKPVNIIYTHSMYVKQLFEEIVGHLEKFVVITHNGDNNIDGTYVVPGNVIHWFAQNVIIDHPRIEALPIGLENNMWFRALRKRDRMIIKTYEPKEYKNLVYMNYNIATNPREREPVFSLFKDKPWVTAVKGTNGRDFDLYLDNLYHHKFIICPAGNGVDTHRFWEALYMKSIPVVKRNINNWFYRDLPVLYVNSWEDVTEELLNSAWPLFTKGTYKMEMLTFEYWKNKILGAL